MDHNTIAKCATVFKRLVLSLLSQPSPRSIIIEEYSAKVVSRHGAHLLVKDEQGNPVSYPSGAFRLVLMRILMEYFLEDQALLEKESSDMIMSKIELNRQAGEYSPSGSSPDGGNSALSKNEGVFDPTL